MSHPRAILLILFHVLCRNQMQCCPNPVGTWLRPNLGDSNANSNVIDRDLRCLISRPTLHLDLLSLLSSQGAVTIMVVPCLSPLPSWWPTVRAMSSKEVLLARQGPRNAILCPTKQGFMPCLLPWDLWAFRVDRF